ncbi:DUF7144 family membrane protein [Amycolatopsis rhizosphaerae]|uniref:DUF7144 family membrane protein n=1 Tax=Amycolatopsis rhizosphaerae TaxID=2053003 RepID=UPI001FE78D9A|nr:hypothetical protein [Amycolatopsis rhizosphaerae]
MANTPHTADGDFPGPVARPEHVTGWTGWIAFAGIMLILLGLFHAVEGLVAVVNPGYYLITASGLVVNVDYVVWGWVHLALGILAVLVGIGLLSGNTVARVVGVILAAISALVNLGFVNAYPAWSALVIALDVVIIYAIIAHGREMKPAR